MPKPIGTLGTIDTLTVGGRVFTDLTNLIILSGQTASGTSQYAGLGLPSSSSQYQVTAGKTLTIVAVSGNVIATPSSGFLVYYADTSIGLTAGSSPGTNAVASNTYRRPAESTGAFIEGPENFAIPATKYVGGNAVSQTIQAYGYEA